MVSDLGSSGQTGDLGAPTSPKAKSAVAKKRSRRKSKSEKKEDVSNQAKVVTELPREVALDPSSRVGPAGVAKEDVEIENSSSASSDDGVDSYVFQDKGWFAHVLAEAKRIVELLRASSCPEALVVQTMTNFGFRWRPPNGRQKRLLEFLLGTLGKGGMG